MKKKMDSNYMARIIFQAFKIWGTIILLFAVILFGIVGIIYSILRIIAQGIW